MAFANRGLLAFLSSYLITSSRDRCPVLGTPRNRWNSRPGSMVLSGATLTADEFPRVFLALYFVLKETEYTGQRSYRSVSDVSSDRFLSMHIDVSFCHRTIDNFSHRG